MPGPYNGDDKYDMLFYGHDMDMAFVNSQQLDLSAQTQASKHLGKSGSCGSILPRGANDN